MLHKQFIRYEVGGLVSNVLLYLGYLLLTAFGMGHKVAMTLLYAVGVSQTFVFNRSWTFGDQGTAARSFVRYVMVYVWGYFVNLIALLVLVDYLGFPHEIVQGCMILLLAVMLFLLQRFWVFEVTAD